MVLHFHYIVLSCCLNTLNIMQEFFNTSTHILDFKWLHWHVDYQLLSIFDDVCSGFGIDLACQADLKYFLHMITALHWTCHDDRNP